MTITLILVLIVALAFSSLVLQLEVTKLQKSVKDLKSVKDIERR